MKDIKIRSWEGLIKEVYEDSYNQRLGRFRSPYAFRGLSADYPLISSLMRLNHKPDKLPDIEKALFRNFKKYAHRDVIASNSDWHWLSIAQHHGLPTRLLDWTYSPFVAMHFMTADLSQIDKDGVIWCVNFMEIQKWLPKKLTDILDREYSNVFTIEMLQEDFRDFRELDHKETQEDFVLFFEPPSLDQRIVNQVALFSFMSRPDVSLDDWLKTRASDDQELYKRIIIPKRLKWEIRDKLDQANINERVLFPGLDGLSGWLKRWYSPKQPSSTPTSTK